MSMSEEDAEVVQSLRQSAAAADAAAARYRRAGRDDDTDRSAKRARRFRQLATAAPDVFAEADRNTAFAAQQAGNAAGGAQ